MREVICTYKDQKYSARDDGSVLRHARDGGRKRKIDHQWTFGKPNDETGYMEIAAVRVHRIVATAFHGAPPTKEHVVDHIDANRRNNRPENLRWVTRLENVLLNPITVKRIEIACSCSIGEVLADFPKYRDKFQEPNYSWMRTVSREEGQSTLQRMLSWAKTDKLPFGGSLGERIYNKSNLQNPRESDTIKAKTLNAVQIDWKVPSEFPLCPQGHTEEPLKTYVENLKTGSLFCKNDHYFSLVSKSAISDDHQNIYVISESANLKPCALAKITYENGIFVHTSFGSFFTQEEVEKEYCLAQGFEWAGGDTFDDNC
ncbi:MAG TPA: HNH endonuclease signature motif containing protein [Puia sp.]|jgi:hypothetical protein|nr:HNH endonuclease signature motif containing protein [Puia sp.]